jgi:maltooligosyltrehalose trehalohydrolase
MVALSGRNEAYFTDYRGTPQEYISAAKWGYLFQGQFSKWQKKRRGTPALDLPPAAFVNYIQNHDQIANYGHGQRAQELAALPLLRAMTALLLLSPQTPMLFQGQEFAASTRFHYFADHNAEIGPLVCQGRVRELSQFPSVATPEMVACMTRPTDRSTFEKCKLDWTEWDHGMHAQMWNLHTDLLRLRGDDPVFSRQFSGREIDGAVLGPDAFVLRFFGDGIQQRLLIINLGIDLHLDIIPEPLLAAPMAMRWETLWSSEDPLYGGCGCPRLETLGEDWRLPGENWRLPGRCAVVLAPLPLSDKERRVEHAVEDKRQQQREAGLGGS